MNQGWEEAGVGEMAVAEEVAAVEEQASAEDSAPASWAPALMQPVRSEHP